MEVSRVEGIRSGAMRILLLVLLAAIPLPLFALFSPPEATTPEDSSANPDSAAADSAAAEGPATDPWKGQNEEFIWYEPPQSTAQSEKEKPYKEWKEALKFTEKQDGLFTIHRKRQDVYFEFTPEDFSRTYLVAMTISRGIGARGLLGGSTWSTSVVELRRVEDAVHLIEMNPRFTADAETPLARAVAMSYGCSVLFSFPIVSINAENEHILVNGSDFLRSDFVGLEFAMPQILGMPARIDGARTILGPIRSFPQNIEVDVDFTVSPQQPSSVYLDTVTDSRYIPVGVHYSLSLLEDTGYRPRLADSRLGYFLTVKKDYTRDDRDTYFRRYINRWHLVKKDSTAEISEPVKPIIYYIDHSVPSEYVPWIKEGIELWQSAFEAAGFKNAIQAIPAPDDDPDFAPEDVRYNTVRWITSSEPSYGAIGPSRVDPRTGQILDADVLVEASMVQGWKVGWTRFTGQKPVASAANATTFVPRDLMVAVPLEVEWLASMSAMMRGASGFGLEFERADGSLAYPIGEPLDALLLSSTFARTAMLARGVITPDQCMPDSILHEAVKWLICHEVGHTLGLRHNFKSSSDIPFAELQNRDYIDRHGFGSVMDYLPANVALTEQSQGYYFRGVLGDYDYWVIRYGYTPIDAATPDDELPVLEAIASESARPGHGYGTDEDAYAATAVDPSVAVFDLSDDPLAWSRSILALSRGLLTDGRLEDRSVLPGKEYSTLRSAAMSIAGQMIFALDTAGRFLGGQYFNRDHRGDPQARNPLVPIPPEKQRAALRLLLAEGLREDPFPIAPELLDRMSPSRWAHWGSNIWQPGYRLDFPLLDIVGYFHAKTIAELTDPTRLALVQELSYKQANAITTGEIFDGLTAAVWTGLDDRPLRMSAFRRNMQRMHANRLVDLWMNPAGAQTSEARALARYHIAELRGRIDRALTSGPGAEVRAHLEDIRARFDAALDARMQAR